jgi:PKD repeat protein
MLKTTYLTILLTILSLSVFSQLTAWQYKTPYKIIERSGSDLINYQVLIIPNTDSLITAGAMLSDGADIRFASDCDGNNLLPYFIETDLVSQDGHIWVQIPSLLANDTINIYLFYGNASATAAVSPFETIFPNSLIIDTDTEIDLNTTTEWNYDWIEIKSGTSVTLPATLPNNLPVAPTAFNLTARRIKIDGNLVGNFAGHSGGKVQANGFGPGGGKQNGAGGIGVSIYFNLGAGGGGAYGGNGGNGGYTNATPTYMGPGGNQYGTSTGYTIAPGSGGASATDANAQANPGGNGGGSFSLKGSSVSISGNIRNNGESIFPSEPILMSGSGGGSGGGVLIDGLIVSITGNVQCNGGEGVTGADTGGGGGSGGRIKTFHELAFSLTGNLEAKGAFYGGGNNLQQEGESGQDGTIFDTIWTSTEPIAIALELPSQILLTGDMDICQGLTGDYNASTGFQVYEFFHNGISQGVGSDFFIDMDNLQHNDTIIVVGSVGACSFTSNAMVINVYDSTFSDYFFTTNELEVSFSNTSTGAGSFSWDFEDGNTSSEESPTHTYATAGTYNVCLEATNNEPAWCANETLCQEVIVSCSNPATLFNISGSELSYSFVDSGNNYNTRQWKIDGMLLSTDSIFEYTFDLSGTYEICLVQSNSCGIDSLCQSIVVDCQLPNAGFDYNTIGTEASFNNLSSENVVSWNWTFGDSEFNDTDQSPTYLYYDSTATYTVCLTVFNACLDSDVYCQDIDVISTTSIHEFSQNNTFTLFPNPSSDFLRVSFSKQQQGRLTIYSLQGEKIWTKHYNADHINVPVTNLQIGNYLLESVSNGTIIIKQFTVH